MGEARGKKARLKELAGLIETPEQFTSFVSQARPHVREGMWKMIYPHLADAIRTQLPPEMPCEVQ